MQKQSIFISYSHKDEDDKNLFTTFLQGTNMPDSFEEWSDRDIEIGSEWEIQIFNAINNATVAIFLLSENFLSSDYIMKKEVPRVLERCKKKQMSFYPILIKPCPWTEHDWLFTKQMLPRDAKSLIEMEEKDRLLALNEIVLNIKRMLYPELIKTKDDTIWELNLRHNSSELSNDETLSINSVESNKKIIDNLQTIIKPQYLFGREKVIKDILDKLFSNSNQPIIIMGIGGIGKTSIAQDVAYQVKEKSLSNFKIILWVDARNYLLKQKTLDIETIINLIFRLFDSNSEKTNYPIEKKIDLAKELLNKNNIFIIFDNFESIQLSNKSDESGIYDLIKIILTNRSNRIIITTRIKPKFLISENFNFAPQIYKIEKLDIESCIKLIERKISDLSLKNKIKKDKYEQIYEITSGIPFFIKFLIGKLNFPFEYIKKQFNNPKITENKNKTSYYEDSDNVFAYIFDNEWNKILEYKQKQILMSLALFVKNASFEGIIHVADLQQDNEVNLIEDLISMSYLDTIIDSKYYQIHPIIQKVCEIKLKNDKKFYKEAILKFIEFFINQLRDNKMTTVDFENDFENIKTAINFSQRYHKSKLLEFYNSSLNNLLWRIGYWPERVEINMIIYDACIQLEEEILAAQILVKDIGFTYLRFEEVVKAEKYINEGKKIFEKFESSNSEAISGKALAIRHLGKINLLKAEYDDEYQNIEEDYDWEKYFQKAEKLYNECESIRRKLPDSIETIADLELDYGRLYWLWGRKYVRDGIQKSNLTYINKGIKLYEKSINKSNNAHSVYKKNNITRGTAKALGNLGNALKSKGIYNSSHNQCQAISDIRNALEYYENAYKIAVEIKKEDEIAHAEWGIAECKELLTNIEPINTQDKIHILEEALKYAEKSYMRYKKMATPWDRETTKYLVAMIEKKLYKLKVES